MIILCLAGCTLLGPNFTTPSAPVEKSWTMPDGTRVTTDHPEDPAWWETFRDPVLDRLIETAYENNLDLRQAGVNVLQARAELAATIGNEYPQQQKAVGGFQHNEQGVNVPGPFGPNDISYNAVQIGVTSSWEIDFWGKFRRAVESADDSFLASIDNYDNALVSLTAQVATTYVTIRTIEQRIRVTRENVETQKSTLKIAEARYKNGATGERDVTQATTQLKETEAAIPPLESSLQQNRNALSALLGMTPGGADPMVAAKGAIPTAPEAVGVGIPRDLLRRRPDIQLAEHTAGAQSALIGFKKADLYPAFSLSGTFAFSSTDRRRSTLADVFSWDSRDFSIGPAVQWNLFNYGQITNQVRAQDAAFQAAVVAYQAAVIEAQREVEDGLVAFAKSKEQVESLREAVASAKRTVQLATVQYREGATDYTTVLTAEQSLLRLQDQLASAEGSVPGNLISVFRALGGGWQIRRGHGFVPKAMKDEMMHRTDWGDLLKTKTVPPTPEQRAAPMRKPVW